MSSLSHDRRGGDPKLGLIIGRIDASLPAVVLFEERAEANNFRVMPDRGMSKTPFLTRQRALDILRRDPQLGDEQLVVLLGIDRGEQQAGQVIAQIKSLRRHARVILLADEVHDSGILAVGHVFARLSRHRASGYLVQGRSSLDAIRHQFAQVFRRPRPRLYPSYPHIETRNVPNRRAFVVTPYNERALSDYVDGMIPAIRKLRLEPFLSTDEATQPLLLPTLMAQLDNCCLVIVNLSEYAIEPGANPNVYLELGYALGQRLPLILVQRKGTPRRLPIDLAGSLPVEYETCAELALRLCFALQ